MSSIILNSLKNIEQKTYLELGVFKNRNFNEIKCQEKYSVDVNGNAMFTGTTDEFFSRIDANKKFDIIFIDANHDYDFVLRDFNNAVKFANEWVLIHDMIPPSKKHTESKFCSDSYKLLFFMLTETNLEIYPMNNNFGLTLIKMPADTINPDDSFKSISFDNFLKFIETQKLYSDEEIVTVLNS